MGRKEWRKEITLSPKVDWLLETDFPLEVTGACQADYLVVDS